MKIDARNLGEFLKGPKKYRGVLLYGPDEGLIRERRKLIAAKAGGADNPLGVSELTPEQIASEPGLLFEALSAMSLLGEAPPVLVRGAGDKIASIVAEAVSAPSSGNFLIVTGGELPKRSSLRVLFEDDRNLAALACYADEAQTIEQVARGFFAKHGISASPEVFGFLKSQLGNDRAVTLSELEKIALYLGDEKTLTPEALMTLVAENRTVEVDDFCHAVLQADKRKMFSLIERLLQEGNQPVMLLRTLARHVERVLQLKTLLQSGMPADRAMMALRPPVFFKERDAMKREAQKRSLPELQAMLAGLLRAELDCKRTSDASLVFRRAVSGLT